MDRAPPQKVDPFFSKLFRLDRTDPLSFGPKFPESLVEWIAPLVFAHCSSARSARGNSCSCLPFTSSWHGQTGRFIVWVNGSQSSGLVNFVPDSRFVTICTNQSHLPENGGEGLKLVSKIIKALKKWNTNFSLEYSIRKTDYLFRCSVAPGNFPLGRAKNSCSTYSL